MWWWCNRKTFPCHTYDTITIILHVPRENELKRANPCALSGWKENYFYSLIITIVFIEDINFTDKWFTKESSKIKKEQKGKIKTNIWIYKN